MTYEKVCRVEDIPDLGVIAVEVDDTPVALVRKGDEVFALHDVCSHAEVRLSEGEVYDDTLECWLHGSCFDIRSGKPTGPPATKPVPIYSVKIDGDDVLVSLSKES
ncbi:Rieske (2Fe-2S) protein [Nonomuraea sediminis]|uniref:Rieske (2Fe-2S) protein n=1 Tax=Nonomuraea sediminis TaxID=2835864 RepID=UPI001BDC8D80|nr:non-heme iron oxygenase ferredoxin subunit [Nonomuraea sediminis]